MARDLRYQHSGVSFVDRTFRTGFLAVVPPIMVVI
jgi:hypothetical protein